MNTRCNSSSFITAVTIMLSAIMLYDVMGAIIKYLGQQYPVQQLSFYRNLFGLIPTLLILMWSENWIQAGKPVLIRQWKLALLRGGLGAIAQICFYLALFHLEFATATTILFAGPIFVTALSVRLLNHQVNLFHWLAVLIGFAGVVSVIRPTSESFSWYALLPLCAAFGYASISVTSRLFDNTVPTALINLYHTFGSLIGATILVIYTGGFMQITGINDWIWLVLMGVAGGLAAFCIISAYRLAVPSSLSPFEYFGIPFSFCLGWVFFSEAPFDRLIPGVFLIIGGGLAISIHEHANHLRKVR